MLVRILVFITFISSFAHAGGDGGGMIFVTLPGNDGGGMITKTLPSTLLSGSDIGTIRVPGEEGGGMWTLPTNFSAVGSIDTEDLTVNLPMSSKLQQQIDAFKRNALIDFSSQGNLRPNTDVFRFSEYQGNVRFQSGNTDIAIDFESFLEAVRATLNQDENSVELELGDTTLTVPLDTLEGTFPSL